jgi:hypothetical protein
MYLPIFSLSFFFFFNDRIKTVNMNLEVELEMYVNLGPVWWYMFVIPATWEVEIQIEVWGGGGLGGRLVRPHLNKQLGVVTGKHRKVDLSPV